MAQIQMTCEFELGQILADLPLVDGGLSEASITRERDTWTLVVTFPAAMPGNGQFDEQGKRLTMFCGGFVVEAVGEVQGGDDEVGASISAAFEEVVSLARDVADTIWIDQSTQGFAGAPPRLRSSALKVDGTKRTLHQAAFYGMREMFAGSPVPTLDDLTAAISESVRPSLSRLLLAQATRWGVADPHASKSAALLLAATACEVAIKHAVLSGTKKDLGSLPSALVPKDRQAPLSPKALLQHVVPLALGKFVENDHPGLLKEYGKLTSLRDTVVHTGAQITRDELWPHLNTARRIILWLES